MGSALLPTLRLKREVDAAIRDTLDKVLVLRFGRTADAACLHLDYILAKSSWDISKFASVALVDMDSEEIQVYIDYFDITLVPATIFFFNAHHMKMDSGTPDHTKWIGSFSIKQDFIDVIERAALKNSLQPCSAALKEHVEKKGILNRSKIPIPVADLRKLVRAAGLGCAAASAVGAVPRTAK